MSEEEKKPATKTERRSMKVVEERNGYKIGINENPDIKHIPEEKRWKLEYPDGQHVSGNEATIRRLFAKMSMKK